MRLTEAPLTEHSPAPEADADELSTPSSPDGRSRSRKRPARAQRTTQHVPAQQAGTQAAQPASPAPAAQTAPSPAAKPSPRSSAGGRGKGGREKPQTPTHTLTGTVRLHPRGFGFADLDEVVTAGTERLDSCFLPPSLVSSALDGDTVSLDAALETSPQGSRLTATAMRQLGRSRTLLLGVVRSDGQSIEVDGWCATNPWKLTSPRAAGSCVLGRIDESGGALEVIECYPSPSSSESLRARALARRELTPSIPEDVIVAGAAAARESVRRLSEPLGQRRDLRGLATITIDADSSRDLDDALSVLPADAGGGVRVYVHIADVAEAVELGGTLDLHAREAGTSVYLPGWNKPMLPHTLSEGALSLLPDQERSALTVEVRIDVHGEVTSVDIYESRISSNQRLSYIQSAEVLAGREVEGISEEVVEMLRWLRTAASRLTQSRSARGGVSAEQIEAELTVSLRGEHATAETQAGQNDANELIERLMVCANEAVAQWLYERGLPGLYRCHVGPKDTAAGELEAFCAQLGVYPGLGAALTPVSLAALARQLEHIDTETGTVWQVLRGHLGRASYTPSNTGHFGLGSARYLHFTSPIRRYADLVVHRIVKSYLAGTRAGSELPHAGELEAIGMLLDERAASASRAEQDARKAGWCAVLERERQAHPRRKLRARVTRVGPSGMHLTLAGSLVTTKVGLAALGRGFTLQGFSLVGPEGRYTLGQQIEVGLRSADAATGLIELQLPARKSARTSKQQ